MSVRRRPSCRTTWPRRWPRTRRPSECGTILTSQNRYAITYRLNSLKRADSRARRLTQYVEMLERGETIYPQKRRP